MARRHGGKKIDFTNWLPLLGDFQAATAGVVAANTLVARNEARTLLRTRGQFFAGIDGLSAPGKMIQIAAGLIAVPEGTGTTVLWSPVTDAEAPWIWYESCVIGYEEMVSDIESDQGLTSFRSVIDSKAMRILRNQEL